MRAGSRPGCRLLPALIALATLSGGCWDRTDIERRALVTAVAVDSVGGQSGVPDTTEPEPGETVRRIRYRLAVEVPFTRALAGGAEGGAAAGPGAPEPALHMSSPATTLAEANREFSNRTYRIPFYGYTQALVIGEDTAREGINPIMDFFMRSFEANWNMNVYISRGEAAPVLTIRPALEDLTGVYLGRLSKRTVNQTARNPNVTLVDVMKGLVTPGAVLIPRLVPAPDQVKLAGTAVVKKGRMVAWLGEIESRAAWLMSGKARGGDLVFAAPWDPRLPITFDINKVKVKKTVRAEGDRLVFDVKLALEGRLSEKQGTRDTYEAKEIRQMEAAAAKAVRAQAQAVLAKTRTMGADAFEFHRLVERKYTDRWRELERDWGAAYARSDARVTVKVRIRNVGAVH